MIRQLAGHTAAYTFANLASRGTVMVWLLVLPSFMSAGDYGVLGLLLTTAALVNVLVPLEISQALARYYPTAEEHEKRGYVMTAWTFTLVMLSIAAAAALVFAGPASELLLGSERYLRVFRIAVGFFWLNTLFYLLQSQFRWEFNIRGYTAVTLVFALVTLAASILLAAFADNALAGVVAGQMLGAAVGVLLSLVALRRSFGFGIRGGRLKQMLRFSLPLVPASVALFLSTYASRFILSDVLDLREVGIFTWASQLATIPALLLLGVQGALTPLVMKHHAEPETKVVLARSFEAVVAIELVLCLGLGAFAPEFIAGLGYSDFVDAAPLVMILAPAFLMLQVYVFAPGFAIAERTNLQLLVSTVSAVSAVALNYWLISTLGLVGAAFATLGASALFVGSWFALSQRLYPIPVRWCRLGGYLLAFTSAAAAVLLLGEISLGAILAKAAIAALLAGLAAASGLVPPAAWRILLCPRRIEKC